MMESSYVGRNIELSQLSEWIERFFEKRAFRTWREKDLKGYRVTARPTHVHDIVGSIAVSVSGGPNDFLLKFVTGNRSRAFIEFGVLTSLFGGGFAYLRGVKSQEAEEKLERIFWIFIEEKINLLTDGVQTVREAEGSSG